MTIFVHCDLDLWLKKSMSHSFLTANMSAKFSKDAHNRQMHRVMEILRCYYILSTTRCMGILNDGCQSVGLNHLHSSQKSLFYGLKYTFFCLHWETKGQGWCVNLVKCEALLKYLHVTCVLFIPNANKKVFSILIFMLKRQATPKK